MFIHDTLSTLFGSAIIPPLAPPNGRPAAAHFDVIVLASLKTSNGVTLGANRKPPFHGLFKVLSITKTPFIPVSWSYTCKTFSGPHLSISSHADVNFNIRIKSHEVILMFLMKIKIKKPQ